MREVQSGERARAGIDECHVLAWAGGWSDDVGPILEELYYERYGSQLQLGWAHFIGGADFKRNVERYPFTDVVIGDREIMNVYAAQGSLCPVTSSELGSDPHADYPSWLDAFCVRRGSQLFGIPVRWGITPVLVRRGLVRSRSKRDTMRHIIDSGVDFLLWSPKGYFLPSMALLATAVSPKSPLVLTDGEFDKLRDVLGKMAEGSTEVAYSASAFMKKIIAGEADVISCAGDWIIRYVERCHPDDYSRIKRDYEYTFPAGVKVPAFFETAGILASGRNPLVASRVVRLLASSAVRRRINGLGGDRESPTDGFFSNPTIGEASVLGPEYKEVPVTQVLRACLPRALPTDHRLCPSYGRWMAAWEEFRQHTKRAES